MFGVVLDITERKQREEELEKTNQLKDEFLTIVSHELRTPLNAILGWANLLRKRNFDKATRDRSLEIIERNALQQNQLVNDILDTSRLMRGQMRLEMSTVNLEIVIENALNSTHLSAEAKSIKLIFNIDGSVGQVIGDANRLQQVVWNLISNAIKFTPKGGNVEIVLSQEDTNAVISVIDNGIGIQSDFLPHLFERFRQGNNFNIHSRQGLGLGLAIVKQLVELHNGTVSATSQGEGQGSTFTVKLPLAGQKIQEEITNQTIDHCASLQNLDILAVDDDTDNLQLISTILESEGANVTALSSAEAALQILEESQPNVLISDIGMQPMDGYALIRQIRLKEINIKAIALTAYTNEENESEALNAGFQLYLSKPVAPKDLVSAVLQVRD